MWDKEDFLKRLHEAQKYQQALLGARTPEERARVVQIVDGFVASFSSILTIAIERSKQDPQFAEQLAKVLNERQHVVTAEPPSSGSTSHA